MLHDLPEPRRLEVRIGQQRFERVHDHAGDVLGVEVGEPLSTGPRGRDRAELLVEKLDVPEAGPERLEARVVEEILAPRDREEVPPVRVGVGQDREVTVLRLEGAARAVQHALVADAVERWHERLPVEVFHHHPRRHALEHRHLDLLAFARSRLVIERGEHGREHGHRARLVGDDGRDVARLADERALHGRET
jgi:hypothetical protein